ncbi:Transposase family tnp2 [Rhizoctonia solani]|uniref:Transposase family tnp2 n=1 Tax=Rhizoctonia solani TaxID=456999 RepID=A0A8H7M0H8_9AGAM|nr:Transposase family tnp2 [Rhizoctonia solani]
MRNLIPLGVIPGPNKPKDFDSFLVPFVEECIDLAKGIDTYNAMTGQTFTLHVHPVIISGDMQAIKYLQNFKGPNGCVPCCGCLMVGVYHADKKTYYIPLAEPIATDSSLANVNSYNPHNLPLCTDKKTSIQTRKIDKALTAGLAEDLRKRTGICGPSILDCIPSIQRPSLYPHEFMHLFLLNHGPALVLLWVGTHPGISDAGSGYYLLLRAVWTAIGIETEEATYLLPARFI